MRKIYEVGDRVTFIGKEDAEVHTLKPGALGTVFSLGVGKSWIWVTFDNVARPIAVHHNEISSIDTK